MRSDVPFLPVSFDPSPSTKNIYVISVKVRGNSRANSRVEEKKTNIDITHLKDSLFCTICILRRFVPFDLRGDDGGVTPISKLRRKRRNWSTKGLKATTLMYLIHSIRLLSLASPSIVRGLSRFTREVDGSPWLSTVTDEAESPSYHRRRHLLSLQRDDSPFCAPRATIQRSGSRLDEREERTPRLVSINITTRRVVPFHRPYTTDYYRREISTSHYGEIPTNRKPVRMRRKSIIFFAALRQCLEGRNAVGAWERLVRARSSSVASGIPFMLN